MKLKNTFEFLFVGKEEGSFLENYAYDLGVGEEDAGQLFISIEIQNNPADAEFIAETIFDSTRKIFFADLEKDVYERFEDALKEVNGTINKFKEETVSKFIGNLHIVMGVVAGKELYLAQTGDAEAYLIRKKYCSVISEGLSDPTQESSETFENIASGTLEPGDFVVFATTRLLRYISKSDFIQTLDPQNMLDSLENLKDALTPEILSKIAIIGMVFHEGLSELSDNEQKGVREYLEDGIPSKIRRAKAKPGRFTGPFKGLWRRVNRSVNNVLTQMTSRKMTKDKILVLLIIVIMLLTGVIWYVKNSGATKREIERIDQVLTEVQEQINTASLRGISNKDAASQILTDAEQKALEVLNSGHHRNKATELLGLIQEEKVALDNVMYVTNPRLIADLSTKRENVSALGLIPFKDHVYAYEYNALYEVLLDRVEDPLTIDDNETVVSGAYDENRGSLLFITKSGKVIQYSNGHFQFMNAEEGAFRKGVAVDVYNGRIYILDKDENQIWRYSRIREMYGSADPYIAEGEINDPVDFAIDGFIYVAQADGTIKKFDRGNEVAFPIAKTPLDPLTSPDRIYTELELNKIFVLESSKNRVLVYDKNADTGGAVYSGQYVFDTINDIRDIYYYKDNNRLYLLNSNSIYEISM